ncbi:hypothetical protein Fmac_012499 [Flemingia macrophylla]|uniref:Uncharacterized protein n=1 Tax=Flemingia macrophylla TaxID=520843 RepID=A0ABD1MQG7_9FABA
MAWCLLQNPTFLKLKPERYESLRSVRRRRGGYIRVRCGGPRSQRGPLVKGRILSIEAIQAIQTLKRLHRINPPNLADLESNTLTRLIKFDLVATLRELLRQQQCALALRVFSTLRSEYGEADLSLYAEIVHALASADMPEHVDRLVLDLNGIRCDDDPKGLVSLIKAVVGAKRRESTVRIYELMKKSGYGSAVAADEYVVKVLVNGLNNFGEEAHAKQLHDQYTRLCPSFLGPNSTRLPFSQFVNILHFYTNTFAHLSGPPM